MTFNNLLLLMFILFLGCKDPDSTFESEKLKPSQQTQQGGFENTSLPVSICITESLVKWAKIKSEEITDENNLSENVEISFGPDSLIVDVSWLYDLDLSTLEALDQHTRLVKETIDTSRFSLSDYNRLKYTYNLSSSCSHVPEIGIETYSELPLISLMRNDKPYLNLILIRGRISAFERFTYDSDMRLIDSVYSYY